MKNNVAKFIDELFIAAAIWLFSALIALYYLSQIYLVVIVATSVTMGISLLLRLKAKKNEENEKNKYNASKMSQHFLFKDDLYALEYFFASLKKRYTVTKHGFYLKINNTFIVPYLTETLSLKKVVYFYSKALRLNAEALVILSYKTEKFPINLKEKLTDIKLEIFDSIKTYRLLKGLNSLPKIEKTKGARFIKLKTLVLSALSPKRAKGYLFSAFILLFGGYFTTMSIYFIVMSAICLTLLVLSKLNIAERFKKA